MRKGGTGSFRILMLGKSWIDRVFDCVSSHKIETPSQGPLSFSLEKVPSFSWSISYEYKLKVQACAGRDLVLILSTVFNSILARATHIVFLFQIAPAFLKYTSTCAAFGCIKVKRVIYLKDLYLRKNVMAVLPRERR